MYLDVLPTVVLVATIALVVMLVRYLVRKGQRRLP
jgi:energy-converting hydrogenase Eha subunit C